ncbi:MAG: IS110 family transposase, partial [Desulfobulbaceae bacterium]|nr:IS110 family transposase [Desulfobulbaceae bacterium]
MRFYTNSHPYYCGIDLHARTLYVCIIDDKSDTLIHKEIKAKPEPLLKLI